LIASRAQVTGGNLDDGVVDGDDRRDLLSCLVEAYRILSRLEVNGMSSAQLQSGSGSDDFARFEGKGDQGHTEENGGKYEVFLSETHDNFDTFIRCVWFVRMV
jgi:hypothetical protein